jgi:hypothetical protein
MTETITRTCARCGAEIIGRGPRAKFCSELCNNRAQHEKWRRRDKQTPKVDTHCEGCLHLTAGRKCQVFRRRQLVKQPCPARRTTQDELSELRRDIRVYAESHGG